MLTVCCPAAAAHTLRGAQIGACARCREALDTRPHAARLQPGSALRLLCPDCWEGEQRAYAQRLAATKRHSVKLWTPAGPETLLGRCNQCAVRGTIGRLGTTSPTFEGSLFEDTCFSAASPSTSGPYERACQEGLEARIAGQQREDCPYQPHPPRSRRQSWRDAWLSGFNASGQDLRSELEARGLARYGEVRWLDAVELFSRAARTGNCDPSRLDVGNTLRAAALYHLDALEGQLGHE